MGRQILQRFANCLEHISNQIEKQCTVEKLTPQIKEVTNSFKIKALTHRVGEGFDM
jgi:hypothetical protein